MRPPGSAPGLTLVELMVTLGIFVGMVTILFTMLHDTLQAWRSGERRRIVYERAAGAMNVLAGDIELALSREPPGVDTVRVKFIGDLNPKSGAQRLMFVRGFESGPERALTLSAGDGRRSVLRFRPPAEEDEAAPSAPPKPPARGAPDRDSFSGKKIGDYKALGGMAQVAYFLDQDTLYRAIRAPAVGRFTEIMNPKAATPIVQDALFLGFDYWGQYTSTWEEQPPRSKIRGPEKIWDSTRGISVQPLKKFFLHRDDSSDDPSDDVFPRLVKITLTVDAPLPRAVHTKLLDEIGEGDGMIYVDSTKGFPKGGTGQSYIKIGREWIRYKEKTHDAFVAERRGARGTLARDHGAESVVRLGRTFTRIVFIPGFREDFTPDEVWAQRRYAETGKTSGRR